MRLHSLLLSEAAAGQWLRRSAGLFFMLAGGAVSQAGETEQPPFDQERSLKHIALNEKGDFYLSIGGELRERFEYFSEPFFGLRGEEQDSYLLHRLLLSADLNAGKYLRAFVQFGNHLETGKQAARGPTDVDEFDVQQGFVDLTIPFDTRSKLMLRAGR